MTNSSLDNAYSTYEISVDWVGVTAILVALAVGYPIWWVVKRRNRR